MLSKRASSVGLAEMESRLLQWLGAETRGELRLYWEIDGRLWAHLEVNLDARSDALRYRWLGESAPRDLSSRAELERLLQRQLLEPAGEALLAHWNGETEPRALLRAMIAENDELRCIWREPAPPPRAPGLL